MGKSAKFKKPIRASWYRQNLLAVSKPRWDVEHETVDNLWRDCEHSEREKEREAWMEETNQLEKLYADEMMRLFKDSRMIAFFHCNPITQRNLKKAWQDGRRIGMELKHYNVRTAKFGLRGTQWENCLRFFMDYDGCHQNDFLEQMILFSPDVKPAQVLKFERKVGEFNLLGAVVENRIVSRSQLQQMVVLPTIDQLRGELVAVLQTPPRQVSQVLEANQQQLVVNLQQYKKGLGGGSGS